MSDTVIAAIIGAAAVIIAAVITLIKKDGNNKNTVKTGKGTRIGSITQAGGDIKRGDR